MFTGLVQQVRKLVKAEADALTVENPGWASSLTAGESIAVQGTCLTLTRWDEKTMRFDVLAETFNRTCLGEKQAGDLLNLERALRMGDAVGGHMVSGHVDGVGVVKAIDQIKRDRHLTIKCDMALCREMVIKGSIACDGVSLTIVDLGEDFFSVHIIPRTWEETSFRELKKGAPVNLETDMTGKYIRHYLENVTMKNNLTIDTLRKAGFML